MELIWLPYETKGIHSNEEVAARSLQLIRSRTAVIRLTTVGHSHPSPAGDGETCPPGSWHLDPRAVYASAHPPALGLVSGGTTHEFQILSASHVLQAGFLDTGTTTKSDLLAAATTGGLSRLFTDQLLQKMRSALGLSAFLKSASDPEEAKQTNAAD